MKVVRELAPQARCGGLQPRAERVQPRGHLGRGRADRGDGGDELFGGYRRFLNLWSMEVAAFNSQCFFRAVACSFGFIIIIVGCINALVIYREYREELNQMGFLDEDQDLLLMTRFTEAS